MLATRSSDIRSPAAIDHADPYGPVQARAKRAFDMFAASAGLLVLAPLLVVIAAAVRLDSRGPVLFRQTRMGRRFRPFSILKFRSMRYAPEAAGAPLTVGHDPRITRVGHWLRRSKLDELPQLINVLTGEMSLVGPRPEVPEFTDLFRDDYVDLLRVRPGITDAASIHFRNEAELLAHSDNPQATYIDDVLPRKLALSREALAHASLGGDVLVILRTLLMLCRRSDRKAAPPVNGPATDAAG
jgi:lipopolysaccharide/colanic/teichoic acid biosynthesis glycosyltransferase